MGLALFAPELVLFSAYRQFSEARKLVKELNELQSAQSKGKGVRARTQNVPKEPTKDAERRQENSQSSRVDVEMGEVRVTHLVLSELFLIFNRMM